MRKAYIVTLLSIFLLFGCDRNTVNPGEIAMVNGKEITLKQLQAAHDTLVLSGDNPSRAVDSLRKEYGEVLSELIVQELVSQYLEKKNMAVTDEELAEEEAQIRADFPSNEFEKLLLSESIDLELWRDSLRKRIGMQKFVNKILRLTVSLNAQEVEEYYMEHQSEFQVPERFDFIQISGLLKDQILAACEQFRQLPDAPTIQARFTTLTIREVHMRVDRLAPEQVSALEPLAILQASKIIELNGEYCAMILLGREKARVMTRTETYSLIENILLEEKIQKAFDKWLENRLAKSDIQVSIHLIPEELRK